MDAAAGDRAEADAGSRHPAPGSADAATDAALQPAIDARVVPRLFLELPDPVRALPHGEEQRSALCSLELDDPVADRFCSGLGPRVTSLAELLELLDVNPRDYTGSRGFAISGHSTGLSKRSVSAHNPRVIFVHLESPADPLLSVAFARGETMVELVTRNRTTRELQFYALSFTLACSEARDGCSPGELLTPGIERNWQSADLYHEEQLKNTAIDCRVCHQPTGPKSSKMLRMQEVELPWTHWFDEQTRGGRALLADYFALHGDEALAGIPASLVRYAQGGLAAAFVRLSGSELQPNEFKSKEIEIEVEHSAPDQPANNRVRGRSETWQGLYQAALRGDAIPTPYHDVKITDPDKVAAMQGAYAEFRAGRLPLEALPDIRDVMPDDAVALAEMGFAVDERLEDRALLRAACGMCHNDRLDQSLTRARFHLDLERLSPEEKQLAVARLMLPGHDASAMPPRRIFELSADARARLIALLQP